MKKNKTSKTNKHLKKNNESKSRRNAANAIDQPSSKENERPNKKVRTEPKKEEVSGKTIMKKKIMSKVTAGRLSTSSDDI